MAAKLTCLTQHSSQLLANKDKLGPHGTDCFRSQMSLIIAFATMSVATSQVALNYSEKKPPILPAAAVLP